ncbi:hypothetical protein F183_A29720 [Bryobacterales bacterium F-183]|nr:hypothetical protein F183_A29720 [Bryobacterales bacterium F-183]
MSQQQQNTPYFTRHEYSTSTGVRKTYTPGATVATEVQTAGEAGAAPFSFAEYVRAQLQKGSK